MTSTIDMPLEGGHAHRVSGKPGALPSGCPLPAVAQMLWYAARPTEFIEWNGRKYGDVFTMRNLAFGANVCVVRPEAIKEVFTGDPETLRAGEANSLLRPVVGTSSVLLLDGDAHMRQRRLMLPAFHGTRMSAYANIMIEETERALARWTPGETIAFRPISQQITLAIILRAVFGTDGPDEQRALGDALRAWIDLGMSPIMGFLATIPKLQRDLGPLSPWKGFLRARAKADELIYDLIARRRGDASEGRADVLSLFLSAKDEQGKPMTDTELRDELVTLLLAGHETTATTLCWLLEELVSRPGVMAEVERELDVVTAGAPLSPTDIPKLRVLDAAIKESMRLRPVIPAVGRRLREPTRIAGHDLPAGVLVVPVVHLTHRLPDLYPDPLTFRLERFLDKKIDPYAWLPFGGGVRRCLGMAFALQELKVVTAVVLARHRLRFAKPRSGRPVLRGVTIAPEGESHFVVE